MQIKVEGRASNSGSESRNIRSMPGRKFISSSQVSFKFRPVPLPKDEKMRSLNGYSFQDSALESGSVKRFERVESDPQATSGLYQPR
jgi:hypothetical protein